MAASQSSSTPKKSTEERAVESGRNGDVVASGHSSADEATAKKNNKSRSQSRKRGSIFGTLLGKKEEHDEKKEVKKEEKAEEKEHRKEEKKIEKEEKKEAEHGHKGATEAAPLDAAAIGMYLLRLNSPWSR